MRLDGGPAFPATDWDSDADGIYSRGSHPGMSLRDAFALAALQTLDWRDPEIPHDANARLAWEIADHMLTEREATP